MAECGQGNVVSRSINPPVTKKGKSVTKRKTASSAAQPSPIRFIHQINLSRPDVISPELATRVA